LGGASSDGTALSLARSLTVPKACPGELCDSGFCSRQGGKGVKEATNRPGQGDGGGTATSGGITLGDVLGGRILSANESKESAVPVARPRAFPSVGSAVVHPSRQGRGHVAALHCGVWRLWPSVPCSAGRLLLHVSCLGGLAPRDGYFARRGARPSHNIQERCCTGGVNPLAAVMGSVREAVTSILDSHVSPSGFGETWRHGWWFPRRPPPPPRIPGGF